jgi:hypothetical protein
MHRIGIPGAQMRGTRGTHRRRENPLFSLGTWATRRISSGFRVSGELAEECFDGQHTVEVWEFEVFGHLDEPDSVLQLAQKHIAPKKP